MEEKPCDAILHDGDWCDNDALPGEDTCRWHRGRLTHGDDRESEYDTLEEKWGLR